VAAEGPLRAVRRVSRAGPHAVDSRSPGDIHFGWQPPKKEPTDGPDADSTRTSGEVQASQ
jgi:hypothetical protein